MSEQIALLEQPTQELTHEDKLWFRAALKECQAMNEHMEIVEVVEDRKQCFNCQS